MVLPLMFTACKKDDPNSQSEIVGLWELTKKYIPEEDRWYNAEVDLDELNQVEFNKDGSGQFSWYKGALQITKFCWALTDTQLRLVYDDRYEAYWLGELNKRELIIQNEDGTSYYKRVR